MRIIDTPEQKEFPGFEHTGKYRQAYSEWFQPIEGHVGQYPIFGSSNERRWILRKLETDKPPQIPFPGFQHTGEFRSPREGEWFQPEAEFGGDGPIEAFDRYYEPRWILRKIESENGPNLFYTKDYIRQIRTSLDIIKEQVDYLEKELFKK